MAMRKRLGYLGFAALLALGFPAHDAIAFSITSQPSNLDAKSSNRIADPEDVMSDMAAQGSGGTYRSSLGGATMQFNGPATAGSGVDSRFVTNPSTVIVPSRH
jgi:hypothetical protein